jgi:hypothetical protein
MLLEWPSLSSLGNEIFKPMIPAKLPDGKSPVVVSHLGKPQALFFVGEDASTGKFEVESLKIIDLTKADEVLTYLLAALVEHASLKKCHTVFLYFDEKAPEASAIKKILGRQGWSEPELYIMSCYFDHSFDPPWLHANFRIPPLFSFVPWRELKPEQITRVKEKGRDSVYPLTLSPFKFENFDPDFSLSLVHKDEVIGWVMTRRIPGNILSYSTIFVEAEYKMMGLAIPMMAESIKRIMQAHIPGAIIDTYVTLSEPYWVDFVNKRLKPRSANVTDIYRSYKRVSTR